LDLHLTTETLIIMHMHITYLAQCICDGHQAMFCKYLVL